MNANKLQLRPAQEEILTYTHGRLAISAVPGSGKTFTLSLLAAQLIAGDQVDAAAGQQVLIVTFLNSSVDTFRARIRKRLDEMALPADRGFDVRTLHSLALEIVRLASSGLGAEGDALSVLDDVQRSHYLSLAVDGWIEQHRAEWLAFLESDTSPQLQARWRDITTRTAATFIRTAKNERYQPEQIHAQLAHAAGRGDRVAQSPLLQMMAGIYGRYQSLLARQATLDFDDLIWQAADLLEQRPDFADQLRQRWPYVLEDEAQDSVPLQELLLETLTGPGGNWVRVGDPNQAVTSTFTAAHPRFFNAFLDRDDVVSRPLPNSGRSAPLILGAANTLLDWVIDHHPVPEVRRHAFRRQHILPTPPGDAQPNPPDSDARLRIQVYRHREDEELPAVAQRAQRYAQRRPDHTLAILVPTNQIGFDLADHLDELDAPYDNLLRGGGHEREIAAAMHAVLAVLADPLNTRALVDAHAGLHELGHPAAQAPPDDLDRFHAALRSVHRPELFLFPVDDPPWESAFPAGVLDEEGLLARQRLADFLRRMFALRDLPVDDLALTLGDELFAWSHDAHETDLAIAYQIATAMRRWRDLQPDWRLPELVAELADVANGRRRLPISVPSDFGYEPEPGRITLATQHSAKGLEWDAVFLIGIDGFWIPGTLDAPFLGVHDFLGGDPQAEAVAQLHYLMSGKADLFADLTATESAHVETIAERLRLLYVGITRARRALYISRSRATRQYNREREAAPATVMGVLYQYLKAHETQ
ncbi:MAG: ATP-dependent helicase [Anaerolineales bacterium]|nr:ATP-dependent helicase [Anaerolineales bacterium]